MLLCDVASLIRLSIRFVVTNSASGTPSRVKPLRQLRLDYNIAPRAASTGEEMGWPGNAGRLERGDAGTRRLGDGETRETRRLGDGETGGRGCSLSPHPTLAPSPHPRVPASPHLRVTLSPHPRVPRLPISGPLSPPRPVSACPRARVPASHF